MSKWRWVTAAVVFAAVATVTWVSVVVLASPSSHDRANLDTHPAAAPPLPTGPRVYQTPAGIAADCSVDVTPEMQAWLGSLQSGSTAVLVRNACYDTEGELLVRGRADLTIEGNDATLRRLHTPTKPGQWRHLQFIGTDDLTVRDLMIDGPKPVRSGYNATYEREGGLAIDSSKNVTVTNVIVKDVWGDGIYLSGRVVNASITDSIVSQAGRQGFTITDGANIRFAGNTVAGAGHWAIDVEPYASTDSVDNVTISKNSLCGDRGSISGIGHWGVTKLIVTKDNKSC